MRRNLLAAGLAAAALLSLLSTAACGDRPAADDGAPGAPAPAPAAADGAPAAEAAAPQNAQPPRDPLAEVEDSIHEAQLFHQRQQSMESYDSCMQKAKELEAPQRNIIEDACKRSRGAPR